MQTHTTTTTILIAVAFANMIMGYPTSFRPSLGGCVSTQFGCCLDDVTPCANITCTNCPSQVLIKPVVGGCVSTQFGCCHDDVTPCANITCTNCPSLDT